MYIIVYTVNRDVFFYLVGMSHEDIAQCNMTLDNMRIKIFPCAV